MLSKLIPARPEDSNLFGLSVSKTKTFSSCKKKYKFSYVEKLPKKDWEFHKFGKFLHEVLENFHEKYIKGCTDPENVVMTQEFKAARKNWELTPDQIKEAYEILITYMKRLSQERQSGKFIKTLHVEKEFFIEIDEKVVLHGLIDKIELEDDVLHIIDYKTSKSDKYLKKDFLQLQTYAFALFLEDPSIKQIKCSYQMLRHNCKLISETYTFNDIKNIEKTFLEYFQNLSSEKEFIPNPSPLCEYCDYLVEPGCQDGQEFMRVHNLRKSGVDISQIGESSWD